MLLLVAGATLREVAMSLLSAGTIYSEVDVEALIFFAGQYWVKLQ